MRGFKVASICFLLLVCASASAAPAGASDRSDEPLMAVAAEGDAFSILLRPFPGKIQNEIPLVRDLFTASADSALFCGPNRPHPHSWLTASVICDKKLDFAMDIGPENGAPIDTVAFAGVAPAAYRVEVRDVEDLEPGVYVLRYLYRDEIVGEFRVKLE